MTKIWIGTAASGKPSFSEQVGINFRLWLQDNEGKKFRITPLDVKPVRSLSQNRLYWVFLNKIEEETGNNANYLHEYYKRYLLPPRFINVKGIELKIPGSTRGLDKAAFSNYMDKISADSGVSIPTKEEAEAMGYISNNKPMR